MDHSGKASVDNFLNYMLLFPSEDPSEIVNFWRHRFDTFGEDLQVPDDFSPSEIAKGVWWRHLVREALFNWSNNINHYLTLFEVAGGVAGCMSRTCTAPLDRLKVFLQVCSVCMLLVKRSRTNEI